MSSVDLGLFGLDCFVTDKASSSLDEEIESLLNETHARNILDISLQQSGVTNNNTMETFNVSLCLFIFLLLFCNFLIKDPLHCTSLKTSFICIIVNKY